MKVDLSIDFDFFIREDPMWDWGHRESKIFLETMWNLRYVSGIDIIKETDINKFADFHPKEMMTNLEKKGFDLDEIRSLHLCESHAGIVNSFNNGDKRTNVLISIDAHHDLWVWKNSKNLRNVGCHNWLDYFIKKGVYDDVTVIYPKWKDMKLDGRLSRKAKDMVDKKSIKFCQWEKLPKEDYEVDRVFICRSGCWVAPHHDNDFLRMLFPFVVSVNAMKTIMYGDIDINKPRHFDLDEITKLREVTLKQIRELYKKHKESERLLKGEK